MTVRTFVEHQHILLQTARRHATEASDLKLVSNVVKFVRNKLAEKYPAIWNQNGQLSLQDFSPVDQNPMQLNKFGTPSPHLLKL